MAKKNKSPVRRLLSPVRIIAATVLGIFVVTWLMYRNFDAEAFYRIEWSWFSTVCITIALLMMGFRDLAYIVRIRILTDGKLSWKQSFYVIMLWEFASSITPSVVGGAAVAMFIINKEGINLGRSTAVVMTSAMLDEIFYITMVPLVIMWIGVAQLFPVNLEKNFFGIYLHTEAIFWIGYCFIVLLTSIILISLFFYPKEFKKLLQKISRIRLFKRWQEGAKKTGDDIEITARELRNKSISFWLGAVSTTYISWFARFVVVNFIILAFTSGGDDILIFGRQLSMWVIMLISPTPGSSGVAEMAFSGFLKEFVPLGLEGTLALLWRAISYYPYLFIGALILPGWLQRVYLKRKLISFRKN